LACQNNDPGQTHAQARAIIDELPGAGFAFVDSMRTGCFLVFDLDEDITARFRNADYAVRFARWLARGRREESSVVVSDETRSGAIVWTEPRWEI